MKFKRITKTAALPTKNEDQVGLNFYSNEHVRILPNQTAEIHTGVTIEEMEDHVLILSLNRKIAQLRPFMMPSGIEIISKLQEGKEITIFLFNRSTNIPAVIDEGECIAYGLKLNLSSLSTLKNTNNRKKVDKTE